MVDLGFIWDGVLQYRRSCLSAIESEFATCSTALTQVEQKIEGIEKTRRRLRRRLRAAAAFNAADRARLASRIDDLWMQMLSLQPRLDRHRRRCEDLAARRFRAARDVESIEVQRQCAIQEITPAAAG